MEGEPLLDTQWDTPSLTPAMQDTSSLESLEELVSLMEYGQGICLLVLVSALLWIRLYACKNDNYNINLLISSTDLHLVGASRSHRPEPKMVLTLCSLLWCYFSYHQLAQILHLESWWSWPAATCADGVFLVHLLMCMLQLALCGDDGRCSYNRCSTDEPFYM